MGSTWQTRRSAADGVTVSRGPKTLDLPAPLRFVHMERPGWREAVTAQDFDALMRADPDAREAFALGGDLLWTVQTWCRLRDAGYGGIELAARPAPGRINLAKSKVWSRLGRPKDCFAVSIQADYPRVAWAQFHLQQNRDLAGKNSAYQSLWPQAAIIPRNPARREVRRVGFLGKVGGNLALGEAEWARLLAGHGLEFVARTPAQWHDFSDIDIALGIRDFSQRPHSHKPPNKLMNAWLADVPFVGGTDSAFRQVGTPDVDYLRVTSVEEAVTTLVRLRDDADLRRRMVEAGRRRVADFTTDAITREWVSNCEGLIAQRYREWAAHPTREAVRGQLLGSAQTAVDSAKAVARTILRRGYEE